MTKSQEMIAFEDWLYANNTPGSNKAGSYVTVIENIGPILRKLPQFADLPDDICTISDVSRLREIWKAVTAEQKKPNGGIFAGSVLTEGYWANNFCSATISNYIKFLNQSNMKSDSGIRYWTYSPGTGADRWDEFRQNGIMALDFDSTDDLRGYEDNEALRRDLQQKSGDEASHKNGVRALLDFRDVMKPGDLVFAKKGLNPFLGVGRVVGDYEFVASAPNMRHRRAVEWFCVKTVELDDKAARKTLTDVTQDKELCKKLDVAYGIGDTKVVKKIEELSTDDLSTFRDQLAAAGLQYDEAFVRRFFAAVQAKQFVVLTGLSGSGKTQLAIQFCEFIARGRHAIVSVGADWTNNEKMLGYPDAVHCGKYVRPESGVLDLVLEASSNPGRPYVLVLDEMNLSHVERYFADFLSAMESKGDLKLHGGKMPVDGVPPTVKMPENLWVIGTMNVDETTYMFSPKVLDRAQVLEFRVKAEDMKAFLDGKQSAAAEALNGFFPELAKVGAEFGYRTAGEFCSYVEKAIALGSPIDEAVDTAIMQKLLPKLHGSRRQLERPLEALWKLCLKPDGAASVETLAKAEGEIDVFPYGNNCKYPISGEKIARIYKNAKNNGFASYAEA